MFTCLRSISKAQKMQFPVFAPTLRKVLKLCGSVEVLMVRKLVLFLVCNSLFRVPLG